MATTKHLSILGKLTATTYQIVADSGPPIVYSTVNRITANTSRLEIGMSIIFLENVGGLLKDTEYFIISDGFTGSYFKVSTSKDGSAETLSDSSSTASFIAYRTFAATVPAPSMVIDSTSSVITVDYSDKLDELIVNTDRLSSTFEASDSTKFADIMQQFIALAEGDGIKTTANWEWLGFISMYQQYVENEGAIGLEALQEYKDKVNTLLRGS
jgi:hypothetical protein